jgi:hypothetical protein
MQVHEIGFGEAITESFYSAAVTRKGAAGDLLKGYFANLDQNRPPMRTACSVNSCGEDQIS